MQRGFQPFINDIATYAGPGLELYNADLIVRKKEQQVLVQQLLIHAVYIDLGQVGIELLQLLQQVRRVQNGGTLLKTSRKPSFVVVERSLLLMGKHLVSLVNFAETGGCKFIRGVLVGVEFMGQSPEGFFDLFRPGLLPYF